jgi:hypothetical protein
MAFADTPMSERAESAAKTHVSDSRRACATNNNGGSALKRV